MAEADFLTRTTLQIEAGTAQESVEKLVQALRRVPGVLLAELNAAGARVVVAHDAGVPTASLLGAASVLGLRTKVVSDTRAPAIRSAAARTAARLPNRNVVFAAAAIIVPVALGLLILVPGLPGNRWALPAVFVGLWAFFFAQMLFRRRP
jgi:cation transport ATPase